jgi:hypothetical protein
MTRGKESIGWVASWLAFAAVLVPTLQASGQQISPVDAATVFDATGKQIGTLQEGRHVLMRLGDNSLVAVVVGKDGFLGNGLAYASSDCSGTPYDFGSGATSDGIHLLVPEALVGPPGNTVYVRQPNATAVGIATMSFLTNGICGAFGVGLAMFPVVPLLDLNAQFTSPFHVVPASTSTPQICGDCNADGAVTANEITRVISNVFNENAGSP